MNLLDRGEATRALVPLEHARARWADKADLHLLLARCHQAVEDWPSAEVAYRRSLELQPLAYVCVLLGAVLDRLGRADEAVWWLHHSLELDPDYEESHYNIGQLLVRQGDLDGADARFRRALELDQDYADAHLALGKLLLGRATELAPDDVRPRESLTAMRALVEVNR